jgi:hypothetical protein
MGVSDHSLLKTTTGEFFNKNNLIDLPSPENHTQKSPLTTALS